MTGVQTCALPISLSLSLSFVCSSLEAYGRRCRVDPAATGIPVTMPWSFNASDSTDYVHRFELGHLLPRHCVVFSATAAASRH